LRTERGLSQTGTHSGTLFQLRDCAELTGSDRRSATTRAGRQLQPRITHEPDLVKLRAAVTDDLTRGRARPPGS
jgi:hypothetical protein